MASAREIGHAFIDRCCDLNARCGRVWGAVVDGVGSGLSVASVLARAYCRREPLPSRPLVVVAAAMACGCVVASVLPVPASVWWCVSATCLTIWAGLVYQNRFNPIAKHQVLATVAIVLAIGSGGASWLVARSDLFCRDDLAWSLSESPSPVAIEGIILESFRSLTPPTADRLRAVSIEPSSECLVAVQGIRSGSIWQPASGRATVIVDGKPPDVVAGSRVRVFGRGVRPAPALNPGEFDFRQRARSLRVLSIVRSHSRECLRVVDKPPLLSLAAIIDQVRTAGIDVLRKHLSAERAPLGAALLLGSRESLPREESREFLVTGTIHILSISGLHVGILALALFGVLRMLAVPRNGSLVAVALCTGFYMLLVRAETPVMRATLLVWLSCMGAAVGRRSLAINALAAAAIIVMAWHPPEVFRIGTQLSFLSTAVLVGAVAALSQQNQSVDPIDRLIDRSRSASHRRLRRMAWQLLEACLIGAAVWAVTAPVVAAQFHVVSPVGLFLNPVIAPLVALAMAWGFLCLLVAPFSTVLAGLFGTACDLTLLCIEQMVAWAAALPGAYAWVAGPPAWWVGGWYLLLLATLLLLSQERLKRIGTWGMVAALWITVGLCAAAGSALFLSRPLSLTVTIAAMGHGCGIVVQSPTGRCLVYDAGRLGAPGAARRAMAAVLWSEGIERIDTLVISHADTDHFNAVPELIERFRISKILVSSAFLESRSIAVAEVLRLARVAGISIETVASGDSIPLDHLCRVRVLHPPNKPLNAQPDSTRGIQGLTSDIPASDNETSIVLAIESAGRRMLLSGDLEGSAMEQFIAADPDSCDVLVAPHHGSRTSLPPLLARATKPEWVVVSGAGGASWPEVRRAYEATRSANGHGGVIQTGSGGAITIELNAAKMSVQQFTRNGWRNVSNPLLTPLEPPFSTATLRLPATQNSR